MTEAENNIQGQDGRDRELVTKSFISGLSQEERLLIILQKELYDGSWQAMTNDLRNRLDGKPYIFKLAHRINDDIARIEKLKLFEQDNNVKLSDYVKPPKT